jgi:endonuclease YncB( thermonuclease family)
MRGEQTTMDSFSLRRRKPIPSLTGDHDSKIVSDGMWREHIGSQHENASGSFSSSTGVNAPTDSKVTTDSNIQKVPPIQEPISLPPKCTGTALCLTGTVTKIVDGDTLDINGTRIRLALVNTPELSQS